MASPDPTEHDRRMTRLEETVGFVDHTAAQLGEQIIAMNRELAAMSRRVALLERRLSDLQDGSVDAAPLVPPPHSAGPDIPREPL
jgi:uncharacterized coiled-coil protein SlyX